MATEKKTLLYKKEGTESGIRDCQRRLLNSLNQMAPLFEALKIGTLKNKAEVIELLKNPVDFCKALIYKNVKESLKEDSNLDVDSLLMMPKNVIEFCNELSRLKNAWHWKSVPPGLQSFDFNGKFSTNEKILNLWIEEKCFVYSDKDIQVIKSQDLDQLAGVLQKLHDSFGMSKEEAIQYLSSDLRVRKDLI